MLVQEGFTARRLDANTVTILTGSSRIGGFTPDAGGTLTLVINGQTVLTAIPVTAGIFTPLPYCLAGTCSLTLAGGAAGCLAVV